MNKIASMSALRQLAACRAGIATGNFPGVAPAMGAAFSAAAHTPDQPKGQTTSPTESRAESSLARPAATGQVMARPRAAHPFQELLDMPLGSFAMQPLRMMRDMENALFGGSMMRNPFELMDRTFEHIPSQMSQLPVDITETDTHLTITAEVPGASKDDVKVDLGQGAITITRKYASPDSAQADASDSDGGSAATEKRMHRRERMQFSGHTTRSFTLPDNVDMAAVEAKLENGELVIRLPKTEPDAPVSRSVPVK